MTRPIVAGLLSIVFSGAALAQMLPQAPAIAKSPKQMAPIDLTGYWVGNITADWRFRMLPGPKGDYEGIPLNAQGRKLANSWDPAADEHAGEQCKAYGAAGIMRLPTRLHITWDNETTLRVETDYGSQTRRFVFGRRAEKSDVSSWQGQSTASWDLVGVTGASMPGGGLKVVTTNMKPGYLRRNGPPYSGNAIMTEFYDVVREANGTQYMLVTEILDDPTYLEKTMMASAQFKKQADPSGWNPTPCAVP